MLQGKCARARAARGKGRFENRSGGGLYFANSPFSTSLYTRSIWRTSEMSFSLMICKGSSAANGTRLLGKRRGAAAAGKDYGVGGKTHSPFRHALTMLGYVAISNFWPPFLSLTTDTLVRICRVGQALPRHHSKEKGSALMSNRTRVHSHLLAHGLLERHDWENRSALARSS